MNLIHGTQGPVCLSHEVLVHGSQVHLPVWCVARVAPSHPPAMRTFHCHPTFAPTLHQTSAESVSESYCT
jgi:hypothetical protein